MINKAIKSMFTSEAAKQVATAEEILTEYAKMNESERVEFDRAIMDAINNDPEFQRKEQKKINYFKQFVK